jgi:hypothetical protein
MTDGLHGVEADVPTGVCREGRRGDAVAQDAGRRLAAAGYELGSHPCSHERMVLRTPAG